MRPFHFNIGAACTRAAERSPEHPAIILDDHGTVKTLSFAELNDASDRMVASLRRAGIQGGDRVAIHLSNSLAFPIVFFGILKCGAIAVPTSSLLTEEERHFILKDSGAALLIDSNNVSAFLSGEARGETAQTRAEDPAYLIYTSGTTGTPKGVLHAHRALLGRQPASDHWLNLKPDDRILHTGKLNWTYTLGTGLMDPLYRGITTILVEAKNNPELWLSLMTKHRASTFITVPTIYRQILQHTTADRSVVPSLRHCVSAGERLDPELKDAWKTRFGLTILEGFGMSECSYYISQVATDSTPRASIGRPQPGHDICLLKEDGGEAEADEEGVIAISKDDPALFLSYWNRPDDKAKMMQKGYFLSGDLAHRDHEGYFYFHGRNDDLIKSFGYRISPLEVETVLKQHESVLDCAVTTETEALGKTLVVAYVVQNPEHPSPEPLLFAHLEKHLAPYKCPKRLYFVPDLPRTPNGKIIRRSLTPP